MEGPPCGVWNHAGSGQQIYFGASQTQNFSIRATAYDNSDQSAISYNMYVHVQPFSCLSGALTSGDVPVNEQKAFLSSNTTRQSQPQAFDLDQNHPNPFNPITEVRFSLPEAAHVLLTIYDVVGRELARLVDQQTDAGYHTVTWDASNVPSGLYLCRFQANGFVKTQRMILLK